MADNGIIAVVVVLGTLVVSLVGLLVFVVVRQYRLLGRMFSELLAAALLDNAAPASRAYVARSIIENTRAPQHYRPVVVDETPEGLVIVEGGNPQ